MAAARRSCCSGAGGARAWARPARQQPLRLPAGRPACVRASPRRLRACHTRTRRAARSPQSRARRERPSHEHTAAARHSAQATSYHMLGRAWTHAPAMSPLQPPAIALIPPPDMGPTAPLEVRLDSWVRGLLVRLQARGRELSVQGLARCDAALGCSSVSPAHLQPSLLSATATMLAKIARRRAAQQGNPHCGQARGCTACWRFGGAKDGSSRECAQSSAAQRPLLPRVRVSQWLAARSTLVPRGER